VNNKGGVGPAGKIRTTVP